jgi:hypothetical protein
MNGTSVPPLQPETLDRLVDALASIGVAANEGDRRFDAESLRASLHNLELRLRNTGYTAGSLIVETLANPHNDVDTLIYDTNHYANLLEAEQAWGRDYRKRLHDRVEKRVEDWLERLQELRLQMLEWLQTPEFETLSIVDQPPATMFEDLMRRFAVAPREMPVFELRDRAKRVMRFQPKGLWIIGANGRIDLITKVAAPIVVDRAEPLTRPSDWQIYDPKGQRRSVPLTVETFRDLVRSGLQ